MVNVIVVGSLLFFALTALYLLRWGRGRVKEHKGLADTLENLLIGVISGGVVLIIGIVGESGNLIIIALGLWVIIILIVAFIGMLTTKNS
jgi:hypothetical protein